MVLVESWGIELKKEEWNAGESIAWADLSLKTIKYMLGWPCCLADICGRVLIARVAGMCNVVSRIHHELWFYRFCVPDFIHCLLLLTDTVYPSSSSLNNDCRWALRLSHGFDVIHRHLCRRGKTSQISSRVSRLANFWTVIQERQCPGPKP